MTVALTENKLKMIEELGVLYEQGGMQPAAARILALLMIADKVELSFEEIYETLHMSKSAVSNAINFLINTGRVEYITLPGERKRYFKCRLQSLTEIIQKSLSGTEALNTMFKKVLTDRPAETADFNNRLMEITQFLDFLKSELPVLFQKWEARKK
jgi:DNA-binding transcriptional regulator GbsR (MarR family)